MEQESAFEEFDVNSNFVRRRDLLPVWIKIFIWLFLIGGSVASLILISGFFLTNVSLSIYGIDSTHPYTIAGFIVCILLIFKGIVAFGLWFELEWAPKAAVIDAITGIAVCIIMMVIIPFVNPNISFTLRLELIPLYFYLIKMQKIGKPWLNA
ncbi:MULTISPECIES: hypothetical protein [Chryseobacterium]|uniref:hypothetical protein n=1 Tax=Chryseobacterium TaxID=59732 RepID=UPI001BE91FBC|nr:MULTISPECIES: hypothetical protein [Chryseobacterium]MBT2619197.1 hypothetical protein [Chryseobacterium sp. ISL-6]